MEFDVARHLGAVERSVTALERDGESMRAVTLARSYDTGVDDLWDAVTNPERLPRWFQRVTGDLRLGGRYQIEGNAGGVIETCEAPRHLALTWEYFGVSWVTVTLSPEGPERSRLVLTHIAPISPHWEEYGPGAAGVGWELGLVGLGSYLDHPATPKLDEEAFAASTEGRGFITGSSDGWRQAWIAHGRDAEQAGAAAGRTTAFYTGQPGT